MLRIPLVECSNENSALNTEENFTQLTLNRGSGILPDLNIHIDR